MVLIAILILGLCFIFGINKIVKCFKGGGEGFSRGGGGLGERKLAVNLFWVKRVNFSDTLSAMGDIKGRSQIELRFEKEGKIEELYISEGQQVKRGDLLARLNQRNLYLKLKQAEIELEQAQKLYELGAIVKSKLKEVSLNAEIAKLELKKTCLYAPRDGFIGDKKGEIGEFITPNIKVATLVDIEEMAVEIGIIERDIEKIRLRQKVRVKVDTYPEKEFWGKVSNISPLIKGKSRTQNVVVELPNSGRLLLPGMFTRVKIFIYQKENALVIPTGALEETAQGFCVYIADGDLAKKREVKLNYVTDDYAEVISGLSAEELVIAEKTNNLKEGTKLEIIEIKEYKP